MKGDKHSSTNIYTIVELLGEGAKGTVYKAEKSDGFGQIKTIVALKVLNSEDWVEIWQKEFQSLKLVRSHFCVHVYGFERVMEKPALSLEYVEGVSLQELVSYTALKPRQIKEIAAQTLLGLKDLWSQKLLHGDLSPANVLVSTDGQVKLLDFGLANRMESIKLGTPQFIAPEVLSGEREDQRSDLFSLGKILEYLCVGDSSDADIQEKVSLLTSKDQQFRVEPNWDTHESVKNELAEVLQEVYRQKKFNLTETREFTVKSVVIPLKNNSEVSDGLKKALYFGVAIFLGVSLLLAYWWQVTGAKAGNLRIRTQAWYKISIDGREYGYTPVEISDLPSGDHVISWQAENSTGKRLLTLGSGENRVINDSFFIEEKGE